MKTSSMYFRLHYSILWTLEVFLFSEEVTRENNRFFDRAMSVTIISSMPSNNNYNFLPAINQITCQRINPNGSLKKGNLH